MTKFRYSTSPVLEPQPGCAWADQMVLNPAIIQDPQSPRLHMLFRASGPWPQMQRADKPLPYPIFLGYAYSDDEGETWQADFSRPALAPRLSEDPAELFVTTADGRRVLNHANGCVEDPRLFHLEGQLYLTCACRMFPPGPYWEGLELTCCTPEWALAGDHALGNAATANVTVSVLYRVDLDALKTGRYEDAFEYITHLTDPEKGDNRDVYLFPEKLRIDGRMQYVCLHRPWTPNAYVEAAGIDRPSMMIAAADRLEDFAAGRAHQQLLATPLFDWEAGRIGGSWPPIRISASDWLVAYHGKQEGPLGYTQSFMILRESADGFPVITHRCADRLMYASRPWELNGKFPTPCLFTCAGIVVDDDLIMTYGAADTRVGVAKVDFASLLQHIRRFDAQGRHKDAGAITAWRGGEKRSVLARGERSITGAA